MKSRKILVVSPHPDDAEFGVGGIIARFVRNGDKVVIAVVTSEGDLHMVHSNTVVPFEIRKQEQMESASILGAGVLFLEIAPASKFDTVPMANFVTRFDKIFCLYDCVYLPLPSFNQDHRIVWDASLAALRPGKADNIQVFAYEEATNFHGQQIFGPLVSRHYVQLTSEDFSKKLLALNKHSSQMIHRENSIAGIGGVSALAVLRGLEIGVPLAEMVYPIRTVDKCLI